MAQIKYEVKYVMEVSWKEFKLITRALAGHQLTGEEKNEARRLNVELLQNSSAVIRDMGKVADRALEVAGMETGTDVKCEKCGAEFPLRQKDKHQCEGINVKER